MNFLTIDYHYLNLFSFVLGMLFASSMWRVRALMFVVFYFMCVSAYFGGLYYMKN